MWNTRPKIFFIVLLAFLFGILLNPLTLVAQQNANHANLLEYYDGDGKPEPVSTPADWYKRRKHILEGMQLAMGNLP
ncbi:MAG: hypothetical protein KAI95_15235, partial [Bacteroidales bacterium]|nr:hypothetical protein [Bacteroidales bacterium]